MRLFILIDFSIYVYKRRAVRIMTNSVWYVNTVKKVGYAIYRSLYTDSASDVDAPQESAGASGDAVAAAAAAPAATLSSSDSLKYVVDMVRRVVLERTSLSAEPGVVRVDSVATTAAAAWPSDAIDGTDGGGSNDNDNAARQTATLDDASSSGSCRYQFSDKTMSPREGHIQIHEKKFDHW